MLPRTLVSLLLLLTAFNMCFAQAPVHSLVISGPNGNRVEKVRQSINGNLYVAGTFSGVVDIDPTPAVFNLTSNGGEDFFIACFNSTDSLLWAVSAGGIDRDGIHDIAVDQQGNVYVAGDFRGDNVDFDPGPGTFLLTENGSSVGITSPPWGGDMFFAKYTSSGTFEWAIGLGGTSVYDIGTAIAVDQAGFVYITGDYHGVIDLDPSPGVANISSADGTTFLAKYTTNGQFVRGFPFGAGGFGGVDNTIRAIKIDDTANIYIAGFFQGTSDFDPSPSSSTILTSQGSNDICVAKYDSSFNLKFAFGIGGSWVDDCDDLALDDDNNIYITGYTSSNSIDLDPSQATNIVFPPGFGADILVAKYSSSGQYQWGHVIGGAGNDGGYGIEVYNGQINLVGHFEDVVDFDPSIGTETLTSAGQGDIFLVKYDLTGNYLCGFNIGAGAYDDGRTVLSTGNYTYLGGIFDGVNVNFNPASGNYPLSSVGAGGYLVKYDWSDSSGNSGMLVGDTVCPGEQAYMTFISSNGPGTYTITYSDGSSIYTTTVQSGTPFALNPNPTSTTTFTLQNISTTGVCKNISTPSGSTAVVEVRSGSAGSFNLNPVNSSVCKGDSINLIASGGSIYQWYPQEILTNTTGPTTTAFPDGATTIYVIIQDTFCSFVDTLKAELGILDSPELTVTKSNDLNCNLPSAELHAHGAYKYSWFPNIAINSTVIANPMVSPQITTTYMVIGEDLSGCKDTAYVKVEVNNDLTGLVFLPTAFTPNNDGMNDCWRMKSLLQFKSFDLMLFNRWGEEVFRGKSINDCWDGTYKGVPQPISTFFYYYKIETYNCGEFTGKGSIELIR